MRLISVHEPSRIRAALTAQAAYHVYELGDLDPLFWPLTTWYGIEDSSEIAALALIYHAFTPPVVLALQQHPGAAFRALIRAIKPLLPWQCYAHLHAVAVEELASEYAITRYGTHLKMALTQPKLVETVDSSSVVGLGLADLPAMHTLYATYPTNSFDPEMVKTGMFVGLWDAEQLIGVGGIHVYAPSEQVAAIGNVVTHPDWRGQGVATKIVAQLITILHEQGITQIGLNVKADNHAAIRCYQRLGFTVLGEYEECLLRRYGPQSPVAPAPTGSNAAPEATTHY